MKDGLLIFDLTSVPLADYHRLPQKPLFKNGIKMTRSNIIKLTCALDKGRINGNLENLKFYNNRRRDQNEPPIYITKHLPKLFQEEQKLLLPHFKKAKSMSQKTSWRA